MAHAIKMGENVLVARTFIGLMLVVDSYCRRYGCRVPSMVADNTGYEDCDDRARLSTRRAIVATRVLAGLA